MTMLKRIVFSVGFSIIIAVAAGYYFEEEKFYRLHSGRDKNEITEKYFNQNARGNEEYFSKELLFNTEKALATGFGHLGVCLITASLWGKRSKK